MDVEDIIPGQNFADTIDRSITSCKVALIVIGPRWNQMLRERAEKKEVDYVSHEVSSALANKLTIVPVLVGGAVMPPKAALPPELSGLAFHQAAELRDNTFKEDCNQLVKKLNLESSPAWKSPKWVSLAIAAAVVALLAGLWGLGITHKTPPDSRLATARTQTELGEHQSAFRTYGEILKTTPGDTGVMDLQAAAAMAWLRGFRVTVGEGQKVEDIAGPPLAEIIGVLESALSRTNRRGPHAGDILAHLGWAHWLNQHIAQKEFGPAAERNLRQALEADPGNFYAHVMLGNWLLQNNGDTAEALRHFDTAEAAGRERPLLRDMQLGGMIYKDTPGIPEALMRIANNMRANHEPLDARQRSRLLTYFRPGNGEQLQKMLSAVSPSDAWATFQWLDPPSSGDGSKFEDFRREFVHGRVLELEGKTAEARSLFTELEHKLRAANASGSLLSDVLAASKRLRSNPAGEKH